MTFDTRLPPGTVFESADWGDVLDAVFDPLDARGDGLWGFTEPEYAAMTRGQQAVFNLRWLRDFTESDTFLSYDEEPTLREHAHRLVEDAKLVGADAFVHVLGEIAPIVAEENEPPFEDGLLDEVERLEGIVFALEEEHGRLWQILADYVRRTPEEFIQP